MRRALPAVLLPLALVACDESPRVSVDRLAIVYIGPSPGAVGIGVDTDVRVTFSEVLRAESVNAGTICVVASGGGADCSANAVPAQVTYDAADLAVTLSPILLLATDHEYAIVVSEGIEGESGSLPVPVRTLFRTTQ